MNISFYLINSQMHKEFEILTLGFKTLCSSTPMTKTSELQESGLPRGPGASALTALEVGGETPGQEPSLWLQRRIRP